MNSVNPSPAITPFDPSRVSFWLFLLLAMVAIFFAKLWLISVVGSPLPYWDQWDAQATHLYIPWMEGNFQWSWKTFGVPHNGHPILFSRLTVMLLFLANQQWDPLVEMTLNAGVQSGNAVLLLLIARVGLNAGQTRAVATLILLLWAFPFGWMNTVSGFQGTFYYLILFSLLALWGLLGHSPRAWAWWLGLVAGIAAIFTLATGFFVAVIVAGLSGVQLLLPGSRKKSLIWNLIAALGMGGLAWWMLNLPDNSATQAQNLSAFFLSLGKNLAWPWVSVPWLSLLMPLPAILLAAFRLARWQAFSSREMVVIGLSAWVFLQAVAMAYSRGMDGVGPAWRYMDILMIGMVSNFVALFLLREGKGNWGWAARGWVTLSLVGLVGLATVGVLPQVRHKQHYNQMSLASAHQFYATGNKEVLRPYPAYPVIESLATWLTYPGLGDYFAAEAQKSPALLTANLALFSAFARDGFFPSTERYRGQDTVGSYTTQGNPSMGVYRSAWFPPPRQRYLQVPVSGYLGKENLSLALELRDGTRISLNPPHLARETWVPILVPSPDREYRVVAEDHNPDFWFAFGAPRGQGWLSYFQRQAGETAHVGFIAALLGVIWLLLPGWTFRSKPDSF